MARDFASTDIVNFGSGAALDDAFGNDGTAMLWVFPDAVPAAGNSTFVRKGTTQVVFGPVAAGWQFSIPRGTQSLLANATYANISTFTASKWCCVAAVWDTAGANGDQRLWHGDLATPMAEVAAYVTQRIGTGAVTDTSAADCTVGSNGDLTATFDGKTGWLGLWNRRLSREEMIAQQRHPHVTSGCVLFSYLGIGASPDADWSGNGNMGTPTGTTLFPNVPNLPLYGGFAGWRGAFTTAVTGRIFKLAGFGGGLAGPARGLAG